MKKYLFILVVAVWLVVLTMTNPSELNAQALLVTLIFMGGSFVYLLGYLIKMITFNRPRDQLVIYKTKGIFVSVIALVFLFLLNNLNTLTMRDVGLSLALAFIANFYLSRISLNNLRSNP